ncbi:MAG: 30S ribosome-binding factor RbfA [Longimicrobiales bacterium]
MAKKRTPRLNEQLRREIIDIVRNHARDPRIGMVTVTDVMVAADLGSARVYVTALGTEDEKAETVAGLKGASAFIRSELGKRLSIRQIPELRFELDQTLEEAHRIEELLGVVRAQDREADAIRLADKEDDTEDVI